MKTLALITFLIGSLFLAACSQPPEQEAISKQDDAAIVDGFCTEVTVTTLNKIQAAATPAEATEPCEALQSLLKGRSCQNQDQLYPEVEHKEKCALALKPNPAQSTPSEFPTPMPTVKDEPKASETLNSCSSEIIDDFINLKTAKLSLDKKKSRVAARKALKQCERIEALTIESPCLAEDSKTKEIKPLTLKSAGLATFCKGLKK